MPDEPSVRPFPLQQLIVRATLHDDPFFNHADPCRVLYGAQPVGDDHDGERRHHATERVLHDSLTLRVQGARRLIQEQHLGLTDQRSGDGDPLLLSAAQHAAPLAHHLLVRLGQLRDEVVSVCGDGGSRHFVHRGFILAVVQEREPFTLVPGVRVLVRAVAACLLQAKDDVSAKRAVKQRGFLRHQADPAFQPPRAQVAEVDPVQGHRAVARHVETLDEVNHRALTPAAGPNERHRLTGFHA